jgi:hypothetical protein
MFPRVRGAGRWPLAAIALAFGIWDLCSSSAMAQVAGIGGGRIAVGPGGRNSLPGYGDGGMAYGIPPAYPAVSSSAGYHGAVSAGYGTFGPGYPGYGLEYVRGCALSFHLHHGRGGGPTPNWCSSVLGKECLYPYVADPYSDPAAAGFWRRYAAPTSGAASW